jgi:hypothetical protein
MIPKAAWLAINPISLIDPAKGRTDGASLC